MLYLLFIAQASQPRDVVLDTVNVLASPLERSRVGGSATYIDDKKLEEHAYTDVHRVLGDTPGVYVREEDGFGLRPNIGLRGVSSDRSAKVTLMEDGVLFAPAPYAAPAAYYFPLMQRIHGVEVWKGSSAIRYGPNTIGGAVNLLTRPLPRKLLAILDVAGGMYSQRTATGTLGWGNDSFSLYLDGGFLANDGFKQLPDKTNTGFDKTEWVLKAGYNTPYDRKIVHQIEVKLGIGTEHSNETYTGLTDDDFAKTPYARYAATARDNMRWWRTQAALTYAISGGELWDVVVTKYRNDLQRNWRRLNTLTGGTLLTDVFRANGQGITGPLVETLRGDRDSTDPLELAINNRNFIAEGVQAIASVHPVIGPVSQDIELGFRFHYDELYRRHDASDYDMRNGQLVKNATPDFATARNRASARAWSVYVQDKITWDRLLVQPGLRMEYVWTRLEDFLQGHASDATMLAFMPGIGAHYAITDWISVLAGVHRGFSPNAPGTAQGQAPEQSTNYEAGVRAQHRYVSGEAIGYFSDYQNITGACTFASGCVDETLGAQFNGGHAFVYGVEASAKSDVPLYHDLALGLSASYTLTLSQFLTAFSSTNPLWGDVEPGYHLPYLPEHQAAASASLHDTKFSVSLSMRYQSDMRNVAGAGAIAPLQRIPQYVYFDAAAHYQLDPRVRVYATIDNVLNANYAVSRQPFGLRPGKPFMFQVGARFTF